MREMIERKMASTGTLDEGVAETIAQQLGGTGRLKAMLGAKYFLKDGKSLQFRFPNRARSKPNFIKITLTGMDDYDVQLGRIGKKKNKEYGFMEDTFKILKTVRGIYADQLVSFLEKETGLAFHL